MTESPSGYYPEFRLPSWFDGPEQLRQLLSRLWQQSYVGLYEGHQPDRPVVDLVQAEVALLDALGDPGEVIPHRRYVYMAWALALASRPTARSWAPHDDRPERVLAALDSFLAGRGSKVAPAEELFPDVVTAPQALHEALDVFRSARQTLGPGDAREALLSALEDCLEGYAVFPGAEGRRDLFNWWLIEVVPAAWMQRLPDEIYTGEWPWPPQPGSATRPPRSDTDSLNRS